MHGVAGHFLANCKRLRLSHSSGLPTIVRVMVAVGWEPHDSEELLA
jgi:hypothetical protein